MLSAVTALRELLAHATATEVNVVSRPTDETSGDAMQLWPWRMDAEPMRMTRPGDCWSHPPVKLSCMVFAEDLDVLELARVAVFSQPSVMRGSKNFSITFEPLDTSDLLSLFIAAKIPPRPCLSYVLREERSVAAS